MQSRVESSKPLISIFSLRRIFYLLALSPYLLLYLSVFLGQQSEFQNLWMLFPCAVIFIVIPLLDRLIGLDHANPDENQKKRLNEGFWFTMLPMLVLPLQGFTLIWAIEVFHTLDLSPGGKLAWIISVGVVGSMVAINSAHELIHRRSRWLQGTGGLLLASMSYGSFKTEHILGHHQNVATPEDASSAEKGQSFYLFLPQAIIRNICCAAKIEKERLAKEGSGFWNRENEFLIWSSVSFLIACMMTIAYGFSGLVFFLGQSLFGIFLLETVNYIEHYGLRRKTRENGTFEPPGPEHSWNYSSFLTNMFLFQLQRHSDHHQKANRRYQLLRHLHEAPQLPASYAAMILLAWFPLLWFKVMNKRVEQYATFS